MGHQDGWRERRNDFETITHRRTPFGPDPAPDAPQALTLIGLTHPGSTRGADL